MCMSSKLIYIKDLDKDAEVHFDPQGVEAAVISWNGKKDYSQYIYEVCLYMRSGNMIHFVVNDDGKKKILENIN